MTELERAKETIEKAVDQYELKNNVELNGFRELLEEVANNV